jgi:hypothetical protein
MNSQRLAEPVVTSLRERLPEAVITEFCDHPQSWLMVAVDGWLVCGYCGTPLKPPSLGRAPSVPHSRKADVTRRYRTD